MPDLMWTDLVGTLRNDGVDFEPGLTDAEVADAESRYGFRFPPDLRAFLRRGKRRSRKNSLDACHISFLVPADISR